MIVKSVTDMQAQVAIETTRRPCFLGRHDFVEAFVTAMIDAAGPTFADGSAIQDYAREVAPGYWADDAARLDGPEACAEADMDCWDRWTE